MKVSLIVSLICLANCVSSFFISNYINFRVELRLWGKQHSQETKDKISRSLQKRNDMNRIEQAASLGLSLDELLVQKNQNRSKECSKSVRTGISDAGRKRISDSMKQRWAEPTFKENYSIKRKTLNNCHLPSTREKISNSIRAKWADDEYRNRQAKVIRTPEWRQRVSIAMKSAWSLNQESLNKRKCIDSFQPKSSIDCCSTAVAVIPTATVGKKTSRTASQTTSAQPHRNPHKKMAIDEIPPPYSSAGASGGLHWTSPDSDEGFISFYDGDQLVQVSETEYFSMLQNDEDDYHDG